MGNILSDANGDPKTAIRDGATSKTINDLLLELDLFNKLSTTKSPRLTKKDAPHDSTSNPYISELDFRQEAITALDQTNPPDDKGYRKDMNNILYKTNDNVNDDKLDTWIDTSTADPKYWKYHDKYYNVKRGFCNATGNVPVNLLGVDLPVDKIETLNIATGTYSTTGTNQVNTNKKMSYDQMNNCLKYGTTQGVNGGYYMIDLTPQYFTPDNLRYLDRHIKLDLGHNLIHALPRNGELVPTSFIFFTTFYYTI
jgi:hypothetical protein